MGRLFTHKESEARLEGLLRLVRVAGDISADVQQLEQWNTSTQQYRAYGEEQLTYLRGVLGRILSDLNELSVVFKGGIRGETSEWVERAKGLLPRLGALSAIREVANQTAGLLQEGSKHSADARSTTILLRLANTVSNSVPTPAQIAKFKEIAEGILAAPSEYVDEADTDRMQQFVQQAVYSGGGDEKQTLRVIRESLQNACDAALKKSRSEPGFVPSVDVVVRPHAEGSKPLMDIAITDNGVGMDWATMSDKFFRYFRTGKLGEEKDVGGFGIGKAVIQESPAHGWAIDTQGIHGNRSVKNFFLGTRRSESYQPPSSQVSKDTKGTTLSLIGLAFIDESDIKDMAGYYAIGGVAIAINGEKISPRFVLSDATSMGQNLSGLVAAVSNSKTEERIAGDTVKKVLVDSSTKPQSLEWNLPNNQFVRIDFAFRKARYGGQLYCMLNGQYQFEAKEYFNKVDVLCLAQTNTRPGTDAYPVDAAREKLRTPYGEAVKDIINTIKRVLDKVGENALFKQGLDINLFNGKFDPLSTDEADPTERAKIAREQFETAMSQEIQEGYFSKENMTGAEVAEGLTRAVKKAPLDANQMATALEVISKIRTDVVADRSKTKENIERIIEGITTPVAVVIQRNFVSTAMTENHPEYTRNMTLLWQSVLRRVVQRSSKLSYKTAKKYIPGVIFSDEAVGVCIPPAPEKTFYSVAINPISIAALLSPTLVKEELRPKEMKGESELKFSDVSTTEKLCTFLFHVACHEAAHLIFPDYWGTDNFHNNITRVELACHFIYKDIREDVRSYLKAIKAESKALLKALKADKKQMEASQ